MLRNRFYMALRQRHASASTVRCPPRRARVTTSGERRGCERENRRGATVLHYACDLRPHLGGIGNPEAEGALIDLLIQHGAKVDHKGGAVALQRAVQARSSVAVRRLLESGTRFDVRLGKLGWLPLHLAVRSGGAGGTVGAVEE